MPSGQRRGRWSGVPLQDRQTLRRDELVAAGVELLGDAAGPALTVRAVCRAAGLTAEQALTRSALFSAAEAGQLTAAPDPGCCPQMTDLVITRARAARDHSFFNPACSTTAAHLTKSSATRVLASAGLSKSGTAPTSA